VLPLPFLPHFLTAAAGMFASPLLDVASDALSVAETVPSSCAKDPLLPSME
jgi:hypothetical protein